MFLRLFRFRLTIRNVNKVDYILGLMADFSFRLTIRNVNIIRNLEETFNRYCFRLTIRNVNQEGQQVVIENVQVLD